MSKSRSVASLTRCTACTTPKGAPYAITGAPRIAKGRVIIGNAGSEYAVRGYVSAYDAGTGTLVWRTYTVPDNGGQYTQSIGLASISLEYLFF